MGVSSNLVAIDRPVDGPCQPGRYTPRAWPELGGIDPFLSESRSMMTIRPPISRRTDPRSPRPRRPPAQSFLGRHGPGVRAFKSVGLGPGALSRRRPGSPPGHGQKRQVIGCRPASPRPRGGEKSEEEVGHGLAARRAGRDPQGGHGAYDGAGRVPGGDRHRLHDRAPGRVVRVPFARAARGGPARSAHQDHDRAQRKDGADLSGRPGRRSSAKTPCLVSGHARPYASLEEMTPTEMLSWCGSFDLVDAPVSVQTPGRRRPALVVVGGGDDRDPRSCLSAEAGRMISRGAQSRLPVGSSARMMAGVVGQGAGDGQRCCWRRRVRWVVGVAFRSPPGQKLQALLHGSSLDRRRRSWQGEFSRAVMTWMRLKV